MNILVTGSAGMIGSSLVKALLKNGFSVIGVDTNNACFEGCYTHYAIDLSSNNLLKQIFEKEHIDRVIHLAALAHTSKGNKYPKSLYNHINVNCSNNVFKMASSFEVPVLFASTVDVYGFQKNTVNVNTHCRPVTIYGKTKYKAEELLINSGCSYSIFRFSPVYSDEIKRDIQKRYYLSYPNWAYLIGKGMSYEVLNIELAVDSMINWCYLQPKNDICIIKDSQLLETKKCVEIERKEHRAKHILHFPRWLFCCFYGIARITGRNKYTFLLNKAIHPLRSE